ncbi:hypothetical protein C7212DRAFT_362537 [Tuber magnatum]|uniref:Uncharacterized protein n=1 Tax=Tuber magnatum TaxID=42249 RepID=A0A317STG0_9PEZI|nr:hypothetical protein C7212DRAFT_362537 [Tuber magnatum]
MPRVSLILRGALRKRALVRRFPNQHPQRSVTSSGGRNTKGILWYRMTGLDKTIGCLRNELALQVADLRKDLGVLSTSFAGVDKKIAIMQWQANLAFIMATGLAGGAVYLGKLVWDIALGDTMEALRAVAKRYIATKME